MLCTQLSQGLQYHVHFKGTSWVTGGGRSWRMQPRDVLIKGGRMKVSLKNQQSFKWNAIAYLFCG